LDQSLFGILVLPRANNDVYVQRDVAVEMTVSTVISTTISDGSVSVSSGDSHFLPWKPIGDFGDSRENLFESYGVTFSLELTVA